MQFYHQGKTCGNFCLVCKNIFSNLVWLFGPLKRLVVQSTFENFTYLFTGNITKLPEAEKLKKRARRPKPSNANKHGTYKNQTMFEETRTILYQFYKPFNRALAQLLNDSRFDYGPF